MLAADLPVWALLHIEFKQINWTCYDLDAGVANENNHMVIWPATAYFTVWFNSAKLSWAAALCG